MVSPSLRRTGTPRHPERGFSYLWILFAVALVSVGLLVVSEVWVTTIRRQQAAQLEWVGTQFVQAIASYYYSSPGGAQVLPAGFDDLLEDRRFLTTRRHLRDIYANPFSGKADWEPVPAGNGKFAGVRVTWQSEQGPQSKAFVFHPTDPRLPAR